MAFLPQKPFSMKVRIMALTSCYAGFTMCVLFYSLPNWCEFKHHGISGSLGVHRICADESDGGHDCRDITGKDFLFFFFQAFSSLGVGAYGLLAITLTLTFCSCCIKSRRAITITRLFVIIFDLVAFNCLTIAIATGLKTGFMGTLKISYGCVLCIMAFSIATVLCPVFVIDARNTAMYLKEWKHRKLTDIQEHDSIEDKPCEMKDYKRKNTYILPAGKKCEPIDYRKKDQFILPANKNDLRSIHM